MSGKEKQFNILHISELAKLNLSSEEENLFGKQISEIISHFSSLQRIDTSTFESKYWEIQDNKIHPVEYLKDDKVQDSFSKEQVFQNAPSKENGFFKIKKILDR